MSPTPHVGSLRGSAWNRAVEVRSLSDCAEAENFSRRRRRRWNSHLDYHVGKSRKECPLRSRLHHRLVEVMKGSSGSGPAGCWRSDERLESAANAALRAAGVNYRVRWKSVIGRAAVLIAAVRRVSYPRAARFLVASVTLNRRTWPQSPGFGGSSAEGGAACGRSLRLWRLAWLFQRRRKCRRRPRTCRRPGRMRGTRISNRHPMTAQHGTCPTALPRSL